MMKPVVVKDCDIQVQPPFSGSVSVTTQPSDIVKFKNGIFKGIYAGGISCTLSNVAGPGFVNGAGSFSYLPTSQFFKFENKSVNFEGDSVTVDVTGQTVPVTIQIMNAGQSVVKAA
jgi:hypothetical protein